MGSDLTFRVLECLRRNTDAVHAVSIKEIQRMLMQYDETAGVSAASIRRTLDNLTCRGYDIRQENGAHNCYQYRLVGRGFTIGELRFLIDSISINQYLSAEQKKKLIQKFEAFCSASELRQLLSRIRIKSCAEPTLDLVQNLDVLHEMIARRYLIQFSYGRYNTAGQMEFYEKNRSVVPREVVIFRNRFYLYCLEIETGKRRTYRVDRMRHITAREPYTGNLTLPKQPGAVLDMFEPDYFEVVTMRIRRYLLDDMKECLPNLSHRPDFQHPDCVILRANIGIHLKRFPRWVMQYGLDIEVLAPQSVRKLVQITMEQAAAMYQNPPCMEEESKETFQMNS